MLIINCHENNHGNNAVVLKVSCAEKEQSNVTKLQLVAQKMEKVKFDYAEASVCR